MRLATVRLIYVVVVITTVMLIVVVEVVVVVVVVVKVVVVVEVHIIDRLFMCCFGTEPLPVGVEVIMNSRKQ